MDPVSLVMAALAAGAVAALKDTAGQAVKDSYDGLKVLLRRKLTRSAAADLVDRHEQDPEGTDPRLRQELGRAGDVDEDLVAAAQRVLALADPAGTAQGKYRVTITGGKGIVVGDNARVEMTFEGGD